MLLWHSNKITLKGNKLEILKNAGTILFTGAINFILLIPRKSGLLDEYTNFNHDS